MRTKQINTGKAEILLVELPEGASNPILKPNSCEIWYSNSLGGYGFSKVLEGNWSILSRADEVTEEQAEKIVEDYGDGYFPYPNEESTPCDTPLESLEYLLESNDVYWDNPLGLGARQYTQARFDLWKAYERNVWKKSRTYILIKHK